MADTLRNFRGPLTIAASGTPGTTLTSSTTLTTLASIVIPPFGGNDLIEIWAFWRANNSANNKTFDYNWAGVTLGAIVTTTSLSHRDVRHIQAAGSSAQRAWIGGAGMGTSSGSAFNTIAANTLVPTTLLLRGQLANAADEMQLMYYQVRRWPFD